ncbi:MAG TPA: cation:proton antiporter [Blastocatellia bacterium]
MAATVFHELLLAVAPRGQVLLSLFIVLVAAKLAAELFERLRQPAVVGEILAGVIIGPAVLNIVQPTDVLEALAEVGVVFLLFTVGLETRPSDIFKVGGSATAVAVLGVIIPFIAGWGLLSLWPGHSWVEAVFLGAAMVATSVGITARVLSGMGLITAEASRVILAAAVIDDVIGLLVLAVTTSLASGRVNYFSLGLTSALAIGFTGLVVAFGSRVVGRMKGRVGSLRIDHSLLVFALVLCFGLAALASVIGIAGIVGAFLAGVALSEATEGTGLHQQSQALTEFTAPFFLVTIGMKLNLTVFSSRVLLLSVAVIILAILTKLLGCGLGAVRMGRRRAVQVGVGMIPRGEVGIVVAQIGIAMAAISDAVYGVVLMMVVITTLAAPPLIKLAFASEKPPEKAPEYIEKLEEIG